MSRGDQETERTGIEATAASPAISLFFNIPFRSHPQLSSLSSSMDPPAGSASKTKRRKLKHEEAPGRIPPSRASTIPCAACTRLAIDHGSIIGETITGEKSRLQANSKDIDFHLEDQLPDLPALQTSFENGCQMCGELRASLTRHPSFQSFAKLRSPSQSALKIELRASLQCASDSRAGSLTFRADLVSGTAVSDHKASPQLTYEICIGENKFNHFYLSDFLSFGQIH
jgi:hypothetical protein